MKKVLLSLAIAIIAFFCGVLTAGIFRVEQKPIPKPLFEKEIFDYSLMKVPPIDAPEKIEVIKNQTFSGWYKLNDYGEMPEVRMILLAKDFEENNSYAGVFTNFYKYGDRGFVEYAWVESNDKKAKFRTKKIKGIEYRFEGTFFKNKTMSEDGEEILRGTLQKFVKGKKVAEVSGDFAYHEPNCRR